MAVITWFKVRREDLAHSDGYFLGGRSLPWFVVAGSMVLTNISTEQLVGLNGGAYLSGMNVMGWEVLAAVALVLLALVLLPVYMRGGITTLPQLIESRYGRSVRVLLALVLVTGLLITILPFVLYTGALSMVGLFNVEAMLGVDRHTAVLVLAVALGVIGGAYAVFGGLKAVAVSDTINGVGLVFGGLLVTWLGLLHLGDGSVAAAVHTLRTVHPEKLNAVTGPESSVPFSTLFTGMLMINISYWCLNQNIIQRAFGARSLADGQKGVLLAGLMKVCGVLILVVPGVIAYHIFDGSLAHGDLAYPRLVELVLPTWMRGFFGAVLFGAILSSFNSTLHSLSTLFSLDVYKTMIRKQASETETVWVGKVFGLLLIVVAIAIVPMLQDTQAGIFDLMKRVGGFFFAGSLGTILLGLIYKRSTPIAPFVGFVLGAFNFGYFVWVRDGVLYSAGDVVVKLHWLHIHALNGAVVFGVMWAIRTWIPTRAPAREAEVIKTTVDLTPWRGVRFAGFGLLALVVLVYVVFSPLGVAK